MSCFRTMKIRLLKKIMKGRHRCMVCISGRAGKRVPGKNMFVRMRRSVGC